MEKQEMQELQKKINRLSNMGIVTMALIVVFAVALFYTISKTSGEANKAATMVAENANGSGESSIESLFDETPADSAAKAHKRALAGSDTSLSEEDEERPTGMEVPTNDVTGCLTAYKDLMATHGITDKVETRTITIQQTSLITLDECFRGRELKTFLRKAANRKRWLNGGKVLSVRVALGVYTKKYLDSVYKDIADPTVRYAKLGRIAIFIITRSRDVNDGDDLGIAKDGDDDDQSFDLGEINPPK